MTRPILRRQPVGAIQYFSQERYAEEVIRLEVLEQSRHEADRIRVKQLVEELCNVVEHERGCDSLLAIEIVAEAIRGGIVERVQN